MSTLYDVQRVTDSVRRRLKASPYAPIRRIDCFFDEGVLVLLGEVSTYYQKQLAQSAVTGLAGVERIANRIRVMDGDGRNS